MGDGRRPSKRRRLTKPHLPHILGFSPFARSLSLARSALAPNPRVSDPSPASKSKSPIPRAANRSSSSSFSDDDDDDDESSSDEDEEQLEMVQADFGFFDPKPGDFNGVKLLLHNYLDHRPWDLSGFVDLILEQTTVGTVIKSDGSDEEGDADEGLYAVISALNLGRYGGHQCIVELKKYLLDVCNDESAKKKLKSLLDEQANDVGLLVSQRFVNCPHQLVPPLYDALFDEVSWATEDEPTQELRDSFRFKLYIIVTKIYEKKNVNQHNAKVKHDGDETFIYIKAEDEIFRELSSLSFSFHLQADQLMPRECFIPSEFGIEPSRMGHALAPGSVTFEDKMTVRKAIEDAEIPHIYVSANCFMGYFVGGLCQPGKIVPSKDIVDMLGDGDKKAIYVDEDDIANYTIKAIDDPRTLNKTLYIRPPENILSQREVVEIWEELSGKRLDKRRISEEDFLILIKGLDYAQQAGLGHYYHIFYEGCLTNFEIGEDGEEASELYPEVQYIRVKDYLKRYL